MRRQLIAVVVPCFRVRSKVLAVVGKVGPKVDMIVVVDGACPRCSAEHVRETCRGPGVHVALSAYAVF